MSTFINYNLSEKLLDAMNKMSYTTPTPVQEQSIPVVLDGKDVLASAQTGTGKTGAFLIPIIHQLQENPKTTALIVAPSRELAQQINTLARQLLSTDRKTKTALLIGGQDIGRQIRDLKQHARIIVGTPGRINDHIRKGTLNLTTCKYLVLDETDRMLDMGFGVQIDDIVTEIPDGRQTMLFSATLPKAITKISAKYLTDPVRIEVGSLNAIADKIEQRILENVGNKNAQLFELLEECGGSIIIFARTQRSVEKLESQIRQAGYKSDILHGGVRQSKRSRITNNFRNGKFDILVATDVAARGLDIPHIAYVINYDLPDNPEDYVHRIGRTARANADGTAISMISNSDDDIKWRNIQNFLTGEKEKYIPLNKKRGGRGGRGRGGNGGGGRGRGRGDGGNGGNGGGRGNGRRGSNGFRDRNERSSGDRDRNFRDGENNGYNGNREDRNSGGGNRSHNRDQQSFRSGNRNDNRDNNRDGGRRNDNRDNNRDGGRRNDNRDNNRDGGRRNDNRGNNRDGGRRNDNRGNNRDGGRRNDNRANNSED